MAATEDPVLAAAQKAMSSAGLFPPLPDELSKKLGSTTESEAFVERICKSYLATGSFDNQTSLQALAHQLDENLRQLDVAVSGGSDLSFLVYRGVATPSVLRDALLREADFQLFVKIFPTMPKAGAQAGVGPEVEEEGEGVGTEGGAGARGGEREGLPSSAARDIEAEEREQRVKTEARLKQESLMYERDVASEQLESLKKTLKEFDEDFSTEQVWYKHLRADYLSLNDAFGFLYGLSTIIRNPALHKDFEGDQSKVAAERILEVLKPKGDIEPKNEAALREFIQKLAAIDYIISDKVEGGSDPTYLSSDDFKKRLNELDPLIQLIFAIRKPAFEKVKSLLKKELVEEYSKSVSTFERKVLDLNTEISRYEDLLAESSEGESGEEEESEEDEVEDEEEEEEGKEGEGDTEADLGQDYPEEFTKSFWEVAREMKVAKAAHKIWTMGCLMAVALISFGPTKAKILAAGSKKKSLGSTIKVGARGSAWLKAILFHLSSFLEICGLVVDAPVSHNTLLGAFTEATFGLQSTHQARQILYFNFKSAPDRKLVYARSVVSLILSVAKTTAGQKAQYLRRSQIVENLQERSPFQYSMTNLTRHGLASVISVKDDAYSHVFDKLTTDAISLGETPGFKKKVMSLMQELNRVAAEFKKQRIQHEQAESARLKKLEESEKKKKEKVPVQEERGLASRG